MGYAFGRRVRAMRRRKGVADEDIAVLGERVDKVGGVLFFALVEARVLEQGDVAVLEPVDDLRRSVADAVVGESDLAFENMFERRDDLAQRIRVDALALRSAKMRKQNDPAAFFHDLVDRRQRTLDARRVGDAPILHRHIEIDAQQHALSFDVDVVESVESGHVGRPIAA